MLRLYRSCVLSFFSRNVEKLQNLGSVIPESNDSVYIIISHTILATILLSSCVIKSLPCYAVGMLALRTLKQIRSSSQDCRSIKFDQNGGRFHVENTLDVVVVVEHGTARSRYYRPEAPDATNGPQCFNTWRTSYPPLVVTQAHSLPGSCALLHVSSTSISNCLTSSTISRLSQWY